MHAIAVHDAEFQDQVLRSDRPVLVDFWAPARGRSHLEILEMYR